MEVIYNLKRQALQNRAEVAVNKFYVKNEPNFRYFKDDTNLNLTSKIRPDLEYRNKSLFNHPKPLQTEHDEEGLNIGFLNNYYGVRDLGGTTLSTYQSLDLSHKKTPKSNIFRAV